MKRSRAPSATGATWNAPRQLTKLTKPTYATRGPTNKTTVNVGRGFPKKMVMTHRYVDSKLLSTGTGGITVTANMACNGMYDPDVGIGGHQPYYFDQMSAIYDHYTVIGSKIKVTFVTQGTQTGTALSPAVCGIFVNDDSTLTAAWPALAEHPSSVCKLSPVSGSGIAVATAKWSAKKTFGGAPLSNDNLQGTSSANPTELSVYTIFVNSEAATAVTNVTVMIEIEYIAVWDELRDVAAS